MMDGLKRILLNNKPKLTSEQKQVQQYRPVCSGARKTPLCCSRSSSRQKKKKKFFHPVSSTATVTPSLSPSTPPAHLARVWLPSGEKRLLAVEGLCEGVAERDHTSLSSRMALHHHPGHLDQLDGALPALQRLGQVQHLGRKTNGCFFNAKPFFWTQIFN